MYQYENGTRRWGKFDGSGDARSYRAPKGWVATGDLIERHPVTGTFLGRSEWWVMEAKAGSRGGAQ